MDETKPSSTELDDDMPLEYNFSGNGIRGKYAQAIRQNGYSITVHHPDGTSTIRHVSPDEVKEQNRQGAQHTHENP
jgi:hypothetical protein